METVLEDEVVRRVIIQGSKGRVSLHELLIGTEAIKHSDPIAIQNSRDLSSCHERRNGHSSFRTVFRKSSVGLQPIVRSEPWR